MKLHIMKVTLIMFDFCIRVGCRVDICRVGTTHFSYTKCNTNLSEKHLSTGKTTSTVALIGFVAKNTFFHYDYVDEQRQGPKPIKMYTGN